VFADFVVGIRRHSAYDVGILFHYTNILVRILFLLDSLFVLLLGFFRKYVAVSLAIELCLLLG